MLVGSWKFGGLADPKIVPSRVGVHNHTTLDFFVFLGGFCCWFRNLAKPGGLPGTTHEKSHENWNWTLTRNLKMCPCKGRLLLEKRTNRFHVSFHGCNISLPLATGNTTCQVLDFLPDFLKQQKRLSLQMKKRTAKKQLDQRLLLEEIPTNSCAKPLHLTMLFISMVSVASFWSLPHFSPQPPTAP